MSQVERLGATVALVAILSGIAVMVAAIVVPGAASAQSVNDLQRQIDRLERQLDQANLRTETTQLEALRIRVDLASRVAAIEREMDLNRRIIYGMALPILGQLVVSFLTLRRLERTPNGPRIVTPGPRA